jgi:hypothetical protein
MEVQSIYIQGHIFESLVKYILKVPFLVISTVSHDIDYFIGELSNECIPRKGCITIEDCITDEVLDLFDNECTYSFGGSKFYFLRRKDVLPTFEDISIVIQGMDSCDTLYSFCIGFLYGKLVASTWNIHQNINEVTQHIEKYKIYNNGNIFYHVLTVLLGINRVQTKMMIKLRCDEVYTNLIPIIETMIGNPDKIITTNIFIRSVDVFPYHCSDHIIAGSTENLRKMFLGAEHLVHNKVPKYPLKYFKNPFWVPEQILTMGFLINHYPLYSLKKENCYDIMNLHFKSVDILSLSPEVIIYQDWWMDNDIWTPHKVRVTSTNLSQHIRKLLDKQSYNRISNMKIFFV